MLKHVHYLQYGSWWYHFSCTDELISQDLAEGKSCVLIKCTGSICRSNLSQDVNTCNKCISLQEALINEKRQQYPGLIDVVNISDQQIPEENLRQIEHVIQQSQTLTELSALATLSPTLVSSIQSTVISQLRNTNPELNQDLKQQLIAMAQRHLALFQLNQIVIAQHQPALVTLVNGRHFDQNAIFYSSREAGVNTRSHETGSAYTDPDSLNYQVFYNKLPQDIFQFKQDHDTYIAKLHTEGLYERRMQEIDTYIRNKVNRTDAANSSCLIDYTAHQITGHIIAKSDKPKIVFFCSSTFECASVANKWAGEDLWCKPGEFASQRKAILALAKAADSMPDYEVIIKCHPNQLNADHSELDAIKQICTNYGLTFIAPDCTSDSYTYASSAALCLVYSSTIGVECVLLNKPTLLLGRALYEDLSVMPVVNSIADIQALLKQLPECTAKNRQQAREYFSFIFHRGTPFNYIDNYKWFAFECQDRVDKQLANLTPLYSSRIALFGANNYSKKLINCFPPGSISLIIDNNSTLKNLSGIKIAKLADIDISELAALDVIIAATDKYFDSMHSQLRAISDHIADKLKPF